GILDVDAYLKCTEGRFPQNLILSHDLLEGAYLNCAFKGDTQLTDGFPRAAAPYFERLHRWTRGDWQTVAWLLPRVRDESGRRVKNPLAAIDKWKIFDNLRRSLTPPCALAAILAGMLDARLLPLSALGAVSLILGHLVAAIDALARGRARPGRRFSYVPGAFGSRIASAFARLALLPLEASVCLTAAVTAVFRMSVSRRNLLQWVTAADSESRGRGGVARYARLGAPGILASLAVILLTPYPPAAAVAIVWALSPLIAASLGREERERGISAPDREYLLGAARDIWRYFAEFLTPEDNFLPPDNYQEAPFTALARRTSPTNIGLALLAPLAAHDLGIIDRDAAVETVGRTLASLQNLEKWRGHPYNWYDTATLQPLEPRYVSTVDSGNLAVCLTVLCGGLRELGETQLADLADTLCRDMDFAPLFDKKRRLFRIGRDMSGGAEQENVYDLMASESMLTSYFAVARGFAPRRHWRALSRAAVRFRGRTGMASWTGTAFEYLMPSLFLPYYKHSLLYESANFCVYSHKKSAKSEPWGSSESAFFAFDASGSYRYKAHGAPALALRRGMGRERVVAPYSSFLALAFDPKGASDNLRKLEELGAVGDYGFREALDFTEERTRGVAPLAVRTYMAHHLGMSIIAVANALGDGAFVRRLLSDADMGAFTELLGERVPAGERTIKSPPRELPERHRTPRIKPWRAVSDEIDAALPRVALLTAGDYGVTFSETGQSESRRKGVALTRAVFEQSGETSGITFFLKSGDELIPLQPAPLFDRAARYSATLSGSGCEIKTRSGKITARVITRVAPDGSGELRRVELASKTACECELAVYFEPVLAGAADYASHPAFSKLSLETELSENCAVVRRRPRGGERGAELAFACDRAAAFDTSRELALGRGGIYAIGAALRREPGGTSGAVLDPCVLARVKISLRPGKTERVAFALSASGNTGEAASRARKLLSRRDASESAAVSQFDAASARFGLSEHTRELAAEMLRELVYPSPYRRVPEILLPSIAIGREGLWSFGVSGDLPIVAQIIGAEGDLDATRELIGAHAVLSECGAPFDLLLLTDEGGEYTSPLRDG
ncbi:MAG: DUF3131 domain-containing protein, partial [Oscillospiraceae bacterium]|nr:DUF3131 domain-containing protein [Oscillospiraceae bacterium]